MEKVLVYACNKTGLGDAVLSDVSDAYKSADSELIGYFNNALSLYEKDELDFSEANSELKEHGMRTGISYRRLALILLLILTPALEARYKQKGLPQDMFDGIIQDIRYKTNECMTVYGEYGTFVLHWYQKIFYPAIFSLGRLQFELRPLDIPLCGFKEGDMRIAVHIPSSGKLDIAECEKSFDRATEFFKNYANAEGKLLFTCNSWLLYEKNPEIITFDSNILRFKNMFTLISTKETNSDVWRIFGVADATDFETLPENTRLMRDFKRYLVKTGTIGTSLGYIVK